MRGPQAKAKIFGTQCLVSVSSGVSNSAGTSCTIAHQPPAPVAESPAQPSLCLEWDSAGPRRLTPLILVPKSAVTTVLLSLGKHEIHLPFPPSWCCLCEKENGVCSVALLVLTLQGWCTASICEVSGQKECVLPAILSSSVHIVMHHSIMCVFWGHLFLYYVFTYAEARKLGTFTVMWVVPDLFFRGTCVLDNMESQENSG